MSNLFGLVVVQGAARIAHTAPDKHQRLRLGKYTLQLAVL